MNQFVTMRMAAALLGLFGVAAAQAQQPTPPPQEPGARMMGTSHPGMYDPATVETIRGEVVSVERVPSKSWTAKGQMEKGMMRAAGPGVHLLVKTSAETISVHLGPAWYLDNQAVKIAPKDRIDVKGSRITLDGKPAIIAAEVRKGDEVLTLRDAKGYPVWGRWRRR